MDVRPTIDSRRWRRLLAAALLLVGPAGAVAQESERLDLSGRGHGDVRRWEFRCDAGRGCGAWTTIAVPSQWELEGFGHYDYGDQEAAKRPDEGRYRLRFTVPERWRGRRIELWFEGVMTDAEVEINGRAAGPRHQGGFMPFAFDVGSLLRYGGDNLLQVRVWEASADDSVNRAERDADYWLFGGIYRPVYLLAHPPASLEPPAIDARADGGLVVALAARGAAAGDRVVARVVDSAGKAVGSPLAGTLSAAGDRPAAELRGRFDGIRPWSAEDPQLYRLELSLERGGEVLHRRRETFGFRTVEVRPGGLYVNGRRVLLKGINRHAFWPDSGRTLSAAIDRRDVELMRAMNLNAVRTSHYPPDRSFLDACDELGLYVVAELPGWKDAYDVAVGRPLVEAMVERDRNHPSVILWANGNEGGWNPALDDDFRRHDPQRRPVLHPDAVFGGFDATHYPTWDELAAALGPGSWWQRWRGLPRPLVMPTEMLHGLYDGGMGAGLEDYWQLIRHSPHGAGAFLWALLDEGVVRTDQDGRLDTFGNYGADGVVGPYRQREVSFYALRDVFAPVMLLDRFLPPAGVALTLENRFDHRDLSSCRLRWRWLALPPPGGGAVVTLAAGETPAPGAPPGARAELPLPPSPPGAPPDALELAVVDAAGDERMRWVVPRERRALRVRRKVARARAAARPVATSAADGEVITLRAGELAAGIERATGELVSLALGGRRLPIARGPRLLAGHRGRLRAGRLYAAGGAQVFAARFDGRLEIVEWRLDASGWLRLSYQYRAAPRQPYAGVGFDLPPDAVAAMRWLGEGPGRTWRNRRRGGRLGLWQRRYNDAVTGVDWQYPEFKGFYAGVDWAELELADGGRLLLALEADDLYLGLLRPRFPERPRNAVAELPAAGLSLLNAIPAIGTKFHPPADLGPQSRTPPAAGRYRGTVWFYVQPPPGSGAGVEDASEAFLAPHR
ncbi:MAG: glycoside hydrolase family 2 [Acidobacteria bacterium]|nr:MAG: glycoside hydrolase family 2 [Acidobacteriota bacterium]